MRRFHDHFSARADAYALHRPRYPAELADYLAAAAPGTALVWEAGCGSGQLSALLAERFERVVATDASAEQLTRAAPHPRVEYRRARAEASGLPGAVADLVVAAQAAHWFDLPAYYAEVARVGRPGALVALITYATMTLGPGLDAVVQHFYAHVLRAYWPPERRHTENGYASLAFPFEEIAVPAHTMRVEWTLAELLGYVSTWSAVAALERTAGRAAFDAFARELAAEWGDADLPRPVAWPLAVRAGYRGGNGWNS